MLFLLVELLRYRTEEGTVVWSCRTVRDRAREESREGGAEAFCPVVLRHWRQTKGEAEVEVEKEDGEDSRDSWLASPRRPARRIGAGWRYAMPPAQRSEFRGDIFAEDRPIGWVEDVLEGSRAEVLRTEIRVSAERGARKTQSIRSSTTFCQWADWRGAMVLGTARQGSSHEHPGSRQGTRSSNSSTPRASQQSPQHSLNHGLKHSFNSRCSRAGAPTEHGMVQIRVGSKYVSSFWT